jgi:hypothetical protein
MDLNFSYNGEVAKSQNRLQVKKQNSAMDDMIQAKQRMD